MKTIGFIVPALLLAAFLNAGAIGLARADDDEDGIVNIIKSIKIKPCKDGKESKDCYSKEDAAEETAPPKDKPCPGHMVQCTISGMTVCASPHACARSAHASIDRSQLDTGGMRCKKGRACKTRVLGENQKSDQPDDSNNDASSPASAGAGSTPSNATYGSTTGSFGATGGSGVKYRARNHHYGRRR